MDNLLSKLTRLHVEERSFTPDGSREPIRYNVAILSIELKGQPQTVELKIRTLASTIEHSYFRVFYFCSTVT